QAEDGIRDKLVTGVQTCALPIFQTAALMVDEVTVVKCLRAHVGELLIAVEPKSGREPGQIKLQQFWRETVDFNAARDVVRKMIRSEERRVGKECRDRGERENGNK